MPPSSWATNDSLKPQAYDLNGAKAAYKASGHSGPIYVNLIKREPDVQIAQIIQAMLKQAGIDLKVQVLERQAWMDQALSGKADLSLGRSTLPDVDPDITMSSYYDKDAPRNYADVQNPKIWELLEKARLETSQEGRQPLCRSSANPGRRLQPTLSVREAGEVCGAQRAEGPQARTGWRRVDVRLGLAGSETISHVHRRPPCFRGAERTVPA